MTAHTASPGSAALLAAEAVTARYVGAAPVLREATLTLAPGRRTAVLGANGSGKTTLLRCLSGAHRPSAGRICFGGTELRHDRAGLRAHRSRVQLVLQDPDDQLFSADVAQDVSFGPLNLGLAEPEVRRRVAEALELVGAAHLAERPTHQLSYGERKRVALAGAVAMRPMVLLLDEPTAGLDPSGVAALLAALARLEAWGTTVVLATHDVDLALSWADEAAVVAGGRVHRGPVTTILDDDELLREGGLARPWPLELARRLGLNDNPRSLDQVVDALRGAAAGAAHDSGRRSQVVGS